MYSLSYDARIKWTKLKQGLVRTLFGQATYDRIVKNRLFSRIERMKFREPEEEFVHYFIREGHVCVDIGAFYGEFTYKFSKLSGPTGKVLAIEPIKYNCEILRSVVERFGLENVVTVEMAVGAEKQTAHMEFPVALGISQTAIARVVTSGSHVESAHSQTVQVSTLDDVFGRLEWGKLDFLKCDVEGAEWMVLQGGEKTISKHFPIVLMEVVEKWLSRNGCHMNDIFDKFDKMGYTPFYMFDGCLVPYDPAVRINDNASIVPGQLIENFFFIPNQKVNGYLSIIKTAENLVENDTRNTP
jgi:FkbM family methyltransferase